MSVNEPTASRGPVGGEKAKSEPGLVLRVLHYAAPDVVGFMLPIGEQTRIGRDKSEEVELSLSQDSRVSRRHVTLLKRGKKLVEHGSKNGTFVDGVRVTGEVAIAPGAILRVGDTLLELTYPAPQRSADKDIIGDSAALAQAVAEIALVAETAVSVLLVGETGTGKEVFAEKLHRASKRTGELVAFNCAALPPNLVEATLFGHKKGAFTGADHDAPGLFQRADGGTLFLDEIAELALDIQAKLLRVLETGDFYPVGATAPAKSKARIVAGTNADLEALVRAGRFRDDLYSRLSAVVVRLPPLRARRGDVLLLARHFFAKLGVPATLSCDDAEALVLYAWPRNVRELRNVVQRIALAVQAGQTPDVRALLQGGALAQASEESDASEDGTNWKKVAMSKDQFLAAVVELEGNVKRLSERFGTERRQIYRWAERFQIDVDAYRKR